MPQRDTVAGLGIEGSVVGVKNGSKHKEAMSGCCTCCTFVYLSKLHGKSTSDWEAGSVAFTPKNPHDTAQPAGIRCVLTVHHLM